MSVSAPCRHLTALKGIRPALSAVRSERMSASGFRGPRPGGVFPRKFFVAGRRLLCHSQGRQDPSPGFSPPSPLTLPRRIAAMQIYLGQTPVDFRHEGGSFLISVDGLCQSFGLTAREIRELGLPLPPEADEGQGYVHLGRFLACLPPWLNARTEALSRGALGPGAIQEHDMRCRLYLLLLGMLGRDLLGSRHIPPGAGGFFAAGFQSAPDLRESARTADAMAKELGELTALCRELAQKPAPDADGPGNQGELSRETELLDRIQTLSWTCTRWLHDLRAAAEKPGQTPKDARLH